MKAIYIQEKLEIKDKEKLVENKTYLSNNESITVMLLGGENNGR